MAKKTYAEFVNECLNGVLVQVYLGDTHEEIYYDGCMKSVPAVLVGKVKDGVGDCLVIDCLSLNDEKKKVFGNLHYCNSNNIKALTPLDGSGTLKDALKSSKDNKIEE